MRRQLHWTLLSVWMLSLVAGMTLFLSPAGVARADSPAYSSRSMWGGVKTWTNTNLQATSPSGATLVTVATGLNSPRHLTWAPDGALIIAEAGMGGETAVDLPGHGTVFYGLSSSITRVDPVTGAQERIVEGLPSWSDESGLEVTGVHQVAYFPAPTPVTQGAEGGPMWSLYALMGLGGTPEGRAAFPEEGILFGHLIRWDGGAWAPVADLAAFEAEFNPDGTVPDSNPYSMIASEALDGFLVADAGGNNLLFVNPMGEIQNLVVFPTGMAPAPPFLGLPPGTEIPYQSVPTSVVIGPDGHPYVGELTGFPFPVGGADVYRVTASEAFDWEVYAEGLTLISAIDFGPDGSLYVLTLTDNLFAPEPPPGYVTRIHPDGTREWVVRNLVAPTGMTVRDDGHLCISNFGVMPGMGQVICVEPVPTAVTLSDVSADSSGGMPLLGLALLALAAPLGAFLVRRRLA
jgi:hypothetical protein